MPDFLLPDLGEGLTGAVIIDWLVEVGDDVAIDQAVVVVETAKAEVEVPVPFAGTVTALFGQPGKSLAVGTPLIRVENSLGASVRAPALAFPSAQAAAGLREPGVIARNGAAGNDVASGNVLIGYGTSAAAPKRRTRPPRHRSDTTRSSSTGTSTAPGERTETAHVLAGPSVTVPVSGIPSEHRPGVISPLVRRIARESGIDLAGIAVDETGVIRRQDVEAEIRRRRHSPPPAAAPPPAAEPPAAAPPRQQPDPMEADPDVRRIPLTGIRRLVADKMSRSRREIPEATVWVDVDATEFLAAREVMNRNNSTSKVSVLGLFSRFAVLGLRTYRELNAHLDGDEIVVPSFVHLGFAAQTDRGLLVPVVRHAETLNARELSAAVSEKATAAKAGKAPPQDLTGSTFTVNNYGVFGVDGSAAIINYPEVAILGMGRIIDRPWAVDGQLVCRKVMQLSLVFDHRVCDGGVAGGFLRLVADCVESPMTALASL